MKHKRAWVILSVLVVLILTGCARYEKCDLLGKTSEQIMDIYGEFDCVGMPADTDGLYRNCCCGYMIRSSRTGFLGTAPEVLFFITFDSDGIAVDYEKGYRPGG